MVRACHQIAAGAGWPVPCWRRRGLASNSDCWSVSETARCCLWVSNKGSLVRSAASSMTHWRKNAAGSPCHCAREVRACCRVPDKLAALLCCGTAPGFLLPTFRHLGNSLGALRTLRYSYPIPLMGSDPLTFYIDPISTCPWTLAPATPPRTTPQLARQGWSRPSAGWPWRLDAARALTGGSQRDGFSSQQTPAQANP